jgi:hypothetical protein
MDHPSSLMFIEFAKDYLSEDDDIHYVIDTRTGKVTWSQALPSSEKPASSATIVEGRLIEAVARVSVCHHKLHDLHLSVEEVRRFFARTWAE